jgi:hypothetical protein
LGRAKNMSLHNPSLQPVEIVDLRPTQISLGMREVQERREQWRERSGKDLEVFLARHVVPTVMGPKKRHYLLDHHHLIRAMSDEGVKTVMVSVTADLSDLSKNSFWVVLDNRSLCHPYDGEGRRRDFDAIPKSIARMEDDHFRSLAAELRRAGGFAKDPTPFSEFQWADFLRSRIKLQKLREDFAEALTQALALAKGRDAKYLPGWCGPDAIK